MNQICEQCGAQITASQTTCPQCGRAVARTPAKKGGGLWILLTVILIVVIAGAVFFLMRAKTPATTALPQAQKESAAIPASSPSARPDTLTGHAKAVNGLLFSKDGQTLISASDDGTVRLWDLATGTSKSVLTREGAEINAIAYAPDGQTLAVGVYNDKNGTVAEIVDISAGTLGATKTKFPMPNDVISSLDYLHDGKTLVAAEALRAKIWDATTGQQVRTLDSGINTISVLSPDGATIATGGTNDKHLSIWAAQSGDKLHEIETSDDGLGIEALAFSPDGKTVTTGGHAALLQLWDTGTWSKKGEAKDPDESSIRQIAFSPTGNVLAALVTHGIRLWSPDLGKVISTVSIDHVQKIAFSPDGQTLAVGLDDGVIKLVPVKL